ncbi:MAG: hypothetical protein SOX32_03675 [Candidatus Choladocola sp.]|nr:hypothetical protein [Candidatus Choladocola sp.]
MRVGKSEHKRKEEKKKQNSGILENLIMRSMEKSFEKALKVVMDDLFKDFPKG